eukprot:SAG31_NODE_613_length_13545_cov_10.972557_12_plen_182_part_00
MQHQGMQCTQAIDLGADVEHESACRIQAAARGWLSRHGPPMVSTYAGLMPELSATETAPPPMPNDSYDGPPLLSRSSNSSPASSAATSYPMQKKKRKGFGCTIGRQHSRPTREFSKRRWQDVSVDISDAELIAAYQKTLLARLKHFTSGSSARSQLMPSDAWREQHIRLHQKRKYQQSGSH